MEKNNKQDNERIQLLIKMFIDSEMEYYIQKKHNIGIVKKYFRYVHLGNRIVRKIISSKNTTFILISKHKDVELKIVKGNGHTNTIITIKNNELQWSIGD